MDTMRNILACGLLILVCGCSHPLEIRGTGEGDIISASGTRNCSQEDYDANDVRCTKNIVFGEYNETYTAVPRPGSQFHRFANYCTKGTTNACSFNIPAEVVYKVIGITVPPLQAVFRKIDVTGYDSLFIGNSFFYGAAVGVQDLANRAGFTDDTTAAFVSGGDTGTPLAFWNNETVAPQIKATLDSGTIDLFGMNWWPSAPGIEGYQNWVKYALGKNPDTRFFIGFPWVSNPGTMTATEYEAAYNQLQATVPHPLVDQLRTANPGVDFYEIPYGQGAVELYKLFANGTLQADGITSLIGPADQAIFKDDFGHAGDILAELNRLIWLRAIFRVDLPTFSYDTGYTTDLKAIAQAIVDNHDANYNAPPEIYPDTDGDSNPDRYDTDDDDDGILDVDDPCPLDPLQGCL